MKYLGMTVVAAALFLVGCTADRTLDVLVPREAFAVVLVDHPALVAGALGAGEGELPWKSLDGNKPWAAAALPANPPGFLLALALADQPSAWPTVQSWAKERGGLEAARIGSYAVLTSPGLTPPSVLDPDRRFDLERVRAGGDPLAVYIDVKNVMDGADFPEALRPAFGVLPWAEKNLAGLRLGFNAKDGGLEVRLATDWKPGSPLGQAVKSWGSSGSPAGWSGLLPRTDGIGVVASLPASAWQGWGAALKEPNLVHRWSALAPLLGPRLGVFAGPQPGGSWAWGAAVETQDPQAVRQALRTLVASGDLQKNFAAWALDPDTPLIYQDRAAPAGGIQALVTLGDSTVHLAYGKDRVVLGSSEAALAGWLGSAGPAAGWTGGAPASSAVLASGLIDGLGAHGAAGALPDGNLELRLWVDGPGLKAWEDRLPQAALSWLSGTGGITRWEP